MATYYELLKHPKWQEKRLRILERDRFACTECFDTTSTLHVHHAYYEKGLAPWEYPDESLETLCESCHEMAGEEDLERARQIGQLDGYQRRVVRGVALAIWMQAHMQAPIDVAFCAIAEGIALAFGTNLEVVLKIAKDDGTVTGERISDRLWELIEAKHQLLAQKE